MFEAEILDETLVINNDMDVAVRAEGVSFTWDSPPPRPEDPKKKGKGGKMDMKMGKHKRAATPIPPPADDANIFKVTDIDLEIPRGQLVAVVGAVGMGKTSLLQGLIGEMRKTAGKVEFGGSVSYCAQNAWIQVGSLIINSCSLITDGTKQNATIRDNICFGRPFDEERYWKAVRDACLEPDLEMLPNHDLTEVGERVIVCFASCGTID